jgi:hypothetical protein
VHVGLDNTGIRLLTNTLSNPVTGQRFDLTTGLKSSVGGMNAGSMKIGSFYGMLMLPCQRQSLLIAFRRAIGILFAHQVVVRW